MLLSLLWTWQHLAISWQASLLEPGACCGRSRYFGARSQQPEHPKCKKKDLQRSPSVGDARLALLGSLIKALTEWSRGSTTHPGHTPQPPGQIPDCPPCSVQLIMKRGLTKVNRSHPLLALPPVSLLLCSAG